MGRGGATSEPLNRCYMNSSLQIDGVYGVSTASYVKSFQIKERLKDKDGLAGDKTLDVMIERSGVCGDSLMQNNLKSIKYDYLKYPEG